MKSMDLIKQMPEMLSGQELYEKLADIPAYDEEIRGKTAVVVQIISPQRHDAVAHQKRQHNERDEPTGNEPCALFFRRGQLERPVGAHRADDHHEHSEKLHPRDGKAHIVHLIRPEVRHKDSRP